MAERRRLKKTNSLKDRLTAFAEETRKKALRMKAGVEREDMLRKARRAETAAHIDEWVGSPGLQPPK